MITATEHSTSVDLIGETGSYGWSCTCGRGSSAPLPLIVAEDLAGLHLARTIRALPCNLEPSRRRCQWCGGEPATIHDLDGSWDTEQCQRYDRQSETTVWRRWSE